MNENTREPYSLVDNPIDRSNNLSGQQSNFARMGKNQLIEVLYLVVIIMHADVCVYGTVPAHVERTLLYAQP